MSPSTQASLLASTTADRGVHTLKVASTTRPSAQESREVNILMFWDRCHRFRILTVTDSFTQWLEGLAALQSDIGNYLKDDLNDDNELDHHGLRMLIRAALVRSRVDKIRMNGQTVNLLYLT
jgi:hypothetical protein